MMDAGSEGPNLEVTQEAEVPCGNHSYPTVLLIFIRSILKILASSFLSVQFTLAGQP